MGDLSDRQNNIVLIVDILLMSPRHGVERLAIQQPREVG